MFGTENRTDVLNFYERKSRSTLLVFNALVQNFKIWLSIQRYVFALASEFLLCDPIAHDLPHAAATFACLATLSECDSKGLGDTYPLLLLRIILPFYALQSLRVPEAHLVVASVCINHAGAVIGSYHFRSTFRVGLCQRD